jgi:hypothetical protein
VSSDARFDPLLAPTRTAVKKLVDKKVGVLVRSSEFHGSTWLFQSIGVCEPKYAYPTKKGEGKKMTKKNLLLVSLFLVFGVVTMATSALAGTQWVPGSSPNAFGRSEGLAEETGIYTLTNNVPGTVNAGDYFTVTYSRPPLASSVYIVCTGVDWLDYPLTDCAGSVTATQTGNTVTLTFATTMTFINTGDEIAVTVRVNATLVKCGTGVTATGVATNVPSTTPNSISITGTPNQAFPVLTVNCEPTLSLGFGTEHGRQEAHGAFVLSCIGTKNLGEYSKKFTINVDEEFANALTSFSYELVSDPDATNGTTFTLVFTNVPTQVTLGLKSDDGIKPCSTLWTGNPLYCPGGSLAIVEEAGQPVVSGTTYTFTFDVTNEDAGFAESVDLEFYFWSKGPLPPGLPQMMCNIYKGPVDVAKTATAPAEIYIPGFTGVLEGPSAGVPWNLSVVEFTDCLTTLLYPYLVNGGNWDSGLAVSNTTLDPFNVPSALDTPSGPNPLDLQPYYGSGSAVQQTGPCTFYLFANGTQPWYAWYTTPAVAPGSTYAFDMGTKLAPGVAGYAIAVCDFQNAHGYAFVTYNLFGENGVAANYVADVLPMPQWYHRTPAGDMLGETAVAPYAIDRYLEKLLLKMTY